MKQPFTMIVAVQLILLDDDKVLLLRRHGTGWANGFYALVAGCLDGNESATQGIIREAYEEANLIIKPEWLEIGCVLHSYIPGRRTDETIDIFFIARQWEGSLHNNEPHKHDDLRFFSLNDLPHPLLPLCQAGLDSALSGIRYAEIGW